MSGMFLVFLSFFIVRYMSSIFSNGFTSIIMMSGHSLVVFVILSWMLWVVFIVWCFFR